MSNMKKTLGLVGLLVAVSSSGSPLGEPIPTKGVRAPLQPPSASRPSGAPVVVPVAPPAFMLQQPAAVAQPAQPVVSYDVVAGDANFRVVLTRWSQQAGWTFAPEHWTVPRDIPVGGTGPLGSDFKAAVRSILAASELSDMPVKPCFYSNQLLRVVSKTAKCDPTKD